MYVFVNFVIDKQLVWSDIQLYTDETVNNILEEDVTTIYVVYPFK